MQIQTFNILAITLSRLLRSKEVWFLDIGGLVIFVGMLVFLYVFRDSSSKDEETPEEAQQWPFELVFSEDLDLRLDTQDALESLSEDERTLLEMVLDGESQKEIADKRGTSQSAVSQKLATIRKKLKQKI